MKLLLRTLDMWRDNGFLAIVVDAPPSAVTFDKMIIVYSENGRTIRKVSLYSSTVDKIILEY